MIKRNPTKAEIAKAREKNRSKMWLTYALMLVCAVMLVSGFFLAGRQHFSSMDVGMKNSRLRKQIDDLEAEKRRLLLIREVALSPAEIKKAVKKIALTDSAATEDQVAQVASATVDKATPTAPSQIKSMIAKTASVAATHTPITTTLLKSEKVEKFVRSEERR